MPGLNWADPWLCFWTLSIGATIICVEKEKVETASLFFSRVSPFDVRPLFTIDYYDGLLMSKAHNYNYVNIIIIMYQHNYNYVNIIIIM